RRGGPGGHGAGAGRQAGGRVRGPPDRAGRGRDGAVRRPGRRRRRRAPAVAARGGRVTPPHRSARSGARAGPAPRPPPPARRPGRPVLALQGWFRLVFAVLAVLAVVAVVAVFGLLAAGRQASGDLEGHILPAQVQAYRLQGALVDQETGVRGFAITGRRDFLRP